MSPSAHANNSQAPLSAVYVKPCGQEVGFPTHALPDHACPGQQHCPAVSRLIIFPGAHSAAAASPPNPASIAAKATLMSIKRNHTRIMIGPPGFQRSQRTHTAAPADL